MMPPLRDVLATYIAREGLALCPLNHLGTAVTLLELLDAVTAAHARCAASGCGICRLLRSLRLQ